MRETTGAWVSVKETASAVFPLTVIVQVFPVVVEAHPVHDVVNPANGAAVSVTCVPFANDAEQADPQLIPAGFEVTVPLP